MERNTNSVVGMSFVQFCLEFPFCLEVVLLECSVSNK